MDELTLGLDPPSLRHAWKSVSLQARRALEDALESPVVKTTSVKGGFSPSLATVATLANSNTVFIKGATTRKEGSTFEKALRNEVRILKHLHDLPAPGVPAPRVLTTVEADGWLLTAFQAIDGQPIPSPWVGSDIDDVLHTVYALDNALDPCPVPDAVGLAEYLEPAFGVWSDLTGTGVRFPDLCNVELASFTSLSPEQLTNAESLWPASMAGNAFVHFDLRADNFLRSNNGKIWIVDWTHPVKGPRWMDLALMLPTVAADGHDPERLWLQSPYRDSPAELVNAAIAAAAGYWVHATTQPAPDNAPGLRPLQRRCAIAALAWLEQRLP